MSTPPDDRHLPLPDADTEHFWERSEQQELVVRFCIDCARHYHYPRRRCPTCLGESTEWREVSGRGQIYSFTVVHQAPGKAFRDRVPFVLALVDLDEGVRLMTNIESDPASVEIGARVSIDWREDGGMKLPVFVLG